VIEIRRYVSLEGKDVFGEWLVSLEKKAAARVAVRLDRLALGNFGDCKSVRNGVFELRIDWGPGYRVYFARIGSSCVLLLGGGDKRKQSRDIQRAFANFEDYQERSRES